MKCEISNEELLDICETTHSHCNDTCPVLNLMTLNEIELVRQGDCPCFKDGEAMRRFIEGERW